MKEKRNLKKDFDVIVVGGGHAGVEASLAAGRMGKRTLLITMNINTIAQMSCNPAIGGPAKGHMVREIDALGGEMGMAIDDTGIQFRMLNLSKGPAVWAPRAQADRSEYSVRLRTAVESQKNLEIFQGMVTDVWLDRDAVGGVELETGRKISAHSVILTCGTFLNGLIHVGMKSYPAGRSGEFPAIGLTSSLQKLGFESGRLKTGTPPRVDGRTVDFSRMEAQPGDRDPQPFSFRTSRLSQEQIPVFLTHTNPATHKILASGLDRSPLYTGKIRGIGPRYCPSIEDKIIRFPTKDQHQIFLEPEGRRSNEYYVNGFATSLPEDIQLRAIRTIKGMEKVRITRLGYAIEYDFFTPTQLWPTLETKTVPGLFLAGQINGTSGYEEAAAQGLMAGINAVLKIRKEEPFVIGRSEGYIGVLIDDLVTKGTSEPYRLFTSRAEYRLLLRHDNADLRLMRYGFRYGLIPKECIRFLEKKEKGIQKTLECIRMVKPETKTINDLLHKVGESPISGRQSVFQLLKRPGIQFRHLKDLPELATIFEGLGPGVEEILRAVEIEVKYEGYFVRQKEQVERFLTLENRRIPQNFEYKKLTTISIEAREKLDRIRPRSLGQAARISGVSPADVSVLAIYLQTMLSSGENVPRGTKRPSRKSHC